MVKLSISKHSFQVADNVPSTSNMSNKGSMARRDMGSKNELRLVQPTEAVSKNAGRRSTRSPAVRMKARSGVEAKLLRANSTMKRSITRKIILIQTITRSIIKKRILIQRTNTRSTGSTTRRNSMVGLVTRRKGLNMVVNNPRMAALSQLDLVVVTKSLVRDMAAATASPGAKSGKSSEVESTNNRLVSMEVVVDLADEEAMKSQCAVVSEMSAESMRLAKNTRKDMAVVVALEVSLGEVADMASGSRR
jgi:hypothetical protein